VELLRKAIAEHQTPSLCVNLAICWSPRDAATWPFPEYRRRSAFALNMPRRVQPGLAFQDQRMVPEAQESFQRAVQLCPERPFCGSAN